MLSSPLVRRVAWRYPLMVLTAMAVGTLALLAFGHRGPGQSSPVFDAWPFLDMWVRWDAGWYEQIAARGYTYSATAQSAAAFFPVYPLLMRGLMALTGVDAYLAGILITWGTGFAATLTFATWALDRSSPDDSSRATWLLLLWPFAYYLLGAVYSDATFLLWVSAAFLLLERRQVAAATLFGAVAAATRPVAPAVIVGLLARNLELRRRAGEKLRPLDFFPLAAGLGLGLYMLFLWVRFGDPLGFATTQVGWNQLSGLDSLLKYKQLQKYQTVDLLLPLFHACLAAGCLWLGWRARRTLGWGYAVYVVAVVGIPVVSSRDFIGLGRYGLAAFPVFLQLSWELDRSPKLRLGWLAASAALLLWMVVRFANGRYIG